MDKQATEDLFTRLFQKVMAALGDTHAAFDPEMQQQAADRGERINRVSAKAIEALGQWIEAGAATAPDPEASARLNATLSELSSCLQNEFVGRYLNLPLLGLGRESSHRVLQAVDAHHRLWACVAQLLNDLNRPYFQSLSQLPEVLADTGHRIGTTEDLYRAIRNVFDEEYHAYLASPEGVRQVAALVDRYLEFKKQFDAAVAPAFKFYGLPTKEEMEDVYSRLHQLKKLQRKYQTRLTRQEAAIEALKQQVDSLQTARAGRTPVKKRKPAPAAKKKAIGKKAPVPRTKLSP